MASPALTQAEMEERERQLVERIQAQYARIREQTAALQSLQTQVHVNVAPKRHALELLRRKIEEQSRVIEAARARRDETARAAGEAAAALEAAERRKRELSDELASLVNQSAAAGMNKLEELQRELERLTGGGGGGGGAAAARAAAEAAAPPPAAATAVPAAAASGAVDGSAAAVDAEAAAAVARHVPPPGRPRPPAARTTPLKSAARREPRDARDADGRFQGFE